MKVSSLQPAWKWKRKLSSQTHWKPVYPHWWCQYKVAYVGYVNATGNCRNKENKQVLRTFRFLELDINILASDFTKAVIDLRFSYLSIYLIYLNNINEQNEINCKTSWRSISVSQSVRELRLKNYKSAHITISVIFDPLTTRTGLEIWQALLLQISS